MSGLTETIPVESHASPQEERFKGIPTELPVRQLHLPLSSNEKETWRPGIVDSNNGLVAAHDPDKPVVHIVTQTDRGVFDGYTPGSANVPLTGADQRAWRGRELSHDLAGLQINAAARQTGVKGRTIQDQEGRDMFTTNPFDDGEFLDMTRVVEVSPAGHEVTTVDMTVAVSQGDISAADLPKSIGKFNTNNGVMSWVTPDGKIQIAPYDEARANRLLSLGYAHGDINVPHSNGEQFAPNQWGDPTSKFANIEFADMKRRGETMTTADRNARYGQIAVPSEYLGTN